jgi:hypothetical protein
MADSDSPAKTPADYDEYGTEPEQEENAPSQQPLKPDEALTDPA